MLYSLGLVLFSLLTFAQDNCIDQFNNRSLGLSHAQEAYACYQNESESETVRELKARNLSQMSYLKFFMAEYHLENKEAPLYEGIELAEKAILLFGPKYSLQTYEKLSSSEKKVLAEALYHYGLTTARYIDIKGQWEAIKRMEDIKKSMNTIIRMKEETTAFYGAHRTLGIFHIKVPYIAGGRIELARNFLTTALSETSFNKDLSIYPANNVAYADLMFKESNIKDGCYHANLVAGLTIEEVRSMNNGLFTETLQSIKDAKNLLQTKKCSTKF
jgi:actin-related protein